jgi:hypothetical protein
MHSSDLVRRFRNKTAVTCTQPNIWISRHSAGVEQICLVDGYLDRLKHTQVFGGVPFKLGQYEDEDGYYFLYKRAIDSLLGVYRKSQNEFLFSRFLQDYGKKMLIG